MGFYYATEKRRFEQFWDKLRREYAEAGMSEADIGLMYEFDLEVFRAERVYVSHTQPLPDETADKASESSAPLYKFPGGTITFDESAFSGRFAWMDTIENRWLAARLKQLSDKDLELLTFLVLEGGSQWELARKWGCSQAAVAQQYKKIKNFFK